MKCSIVTFGCRVNQADSFAIEEALRQRGAVDAPPEDADLVVINTCSVTATRRSRRATDDQTDCPQQPRRQAWWSPAATRRAGPMNIRELPNVVRIVGERRRRMRSSARSMLTASWTTAQRFDGADGPCGMALEPGVAGRTALTLRVQTGCDEECSYCIIPAHAWGRPFAAARRSASRRSTAPSMPVTARSPSPAFTSDRMVAISATARRSRASFGSSARVA